MLTHDQVWRGIDRLALRNELSASGLAKRAGLDPTTFNKSKRVTKEGKLRWPSTESLAKILDATRTPMSDFVKLVDGVDTGDVSVDPPRLKFIRMTDLQASSATDEAGFPVGPDWEEIDFPLVEDNSGYVVELDQDMGLPTYRAGDMMVVSPTSGIRRNDRVMIRKTSGQMIVGILERRTAHRINVYSVDDKAERTELNMVEVAWLARIIWLSQ